MKRLKYRRGFGVTVALAIGILLLSGGCTSQGAVDKVGVYVTGGMIQGHHFKKVILQGSGSTPKGWGDDVHWLPAGVRDYTVSKKANEGDVKGFDAITVPALGGVLMDYELQVNFRLNTSCEDSKSRDSCVIRKFWEDIGSKFHADEDKGWDNLLNTRLRRQLETAILARTRQTDPGQLYANQAGAGSTAKNTEDVLVNLQTAVGQTITDDVNSNLGGPFFCGPRFDRTKFDENHASVCPPMTFTINSITPHVDATVESFEAIRRSANDVLVATNDAKAAEQRGLAAKNQQDAQGAITQNFIDYTRAQAEMTCAQRPGCTLIIGGANVNVNAGKP